MLLEETDRSKSGGIPGFVDAVENLSEIRAIFMPADPAPLRSGVRVGA